MADTIRGLSGACHHGRHTDCAYADCGCRCHRELTLAEKIEDLAASPLPDSQRLQVLIQLTAQLAGGKQKWAK